MHPLTEQDQTQLCHSLQILFNLFLILLMMDVLSKKNILVLHYSFTPNVFLDICNLIIFLFVLTTMD